MPDPSLDGIRAFMDSFVRTIQALILNAEKRLSLDFDGHEPGQVLLILEPYFDTIRLLS